MDTQGKRKGFESVIEEIDSHAMRMEMAAILLNLWKKCKLYIISKHYLITCPARKIVRITMPVDDAPIDP